MDTDMTQNFERAKLVKKMREERAWPQRQLADVANINLRTVQRLERNGAASFETLMAVAQAFGIDVKELNPTSRAPQKHKPQTKVYLLPRLTSGKSVADIISGSELFQVSHDTADDERAVNAMKSILELFRGDIVRWYDSNPGEKLKVELELSQELKGIEAYGFYLFGIKREIPRIIGKRKTQTTMCTVYMSHSGSPKIVQDRNSNMAIPAVLSEVAR